MKVLSELKSPESLRDIENHAELISDCAYGLRVPEKMTMQQASIKIWELKHHLLKLEMSLYIDSTEQYKFDDIK